VDVVVKGRHQAVGEAFKAHAVEKCTKLERLDQRVMRVDVEVSKERNPRQADLRERVELTCISKGPVVRAEASARDEYAALDLALAKIEGRLRRAADRRRAHRGARLGSADAGLGTVAAAIPAAGAATDTVAPVTVVPAEDRDRAVAAAAASGAGESPVVVREKVHAAAPMSLDVALFEMELVGHDFYLFTDAGSHQPSVVYKRRGYDYGVIRLQT
jgi:ribosomal subunit interface protein